MDCLSLIVEARAAGLAISVDGKRLVVRGPRKHAGLARRLLANKAGVLEELRRLEERAEVGGVTRETLRLIGNGFPPRICPPPPEAILAKTPTLCPVCGRCPVLAELRHLTGGRCYTCFANPIRPNVPTQNNFPHGAKSC